MGGGNAADAVKEAPLNLSQLRANPQIHQAQLGLNHAVSQPHSFARTYSWSYGKIGHKRDSFAP
jgi:hypothetical protein